MEDARTMFCECDTLDAISLCSVMEDDYHEDLRSLSPRRVTQHGTIRLSTYIPTIEQLTLVAYVVAR